jgi:hypothetical protein
MYPWEVRGDSVENAGLGVSGLWNIHVYNGYSRLEILQRCKMNWLKEWPVLKNTTQTSGQAGLKRNGPTELRY